MKPPPHPANFKGTPAEWLFWQELYERDLLRPTGWLSPDDYSSAYLARFVDENGEPTDGYPLDERDITEDMCLACGRFREIVEVEVEREGIRRTVTECPDPCLGMLPGVLFACCGHGRRAGCYIVGPVGNLSGPAAARKMRELGGDPPAAAFYLDPIGPR